LGLKPRGKEWDLKFELKDGSKVDCVKQAIRKVMPFMPETSKAIFEQFLKQLEEDRLRNKRLSSQVL
jgi:hypothetical protein